ncbi:hypothetical protein [Pontibacter arcticus]|uniref:DUF4352 domain-containing protein n=1 Tax=Pontibacter arcticus TaxID=2080288 RepID=A0A364RDB5_9BACT|nr:hypothetical protein [Pontibacter arcticus]RAU82292.1 hypothetical protein DP923_10910 [Pontibacter arcticus]
MKKNLYLCATVAAMFLFSCDSKTQDETTDTSTTTTETGNSEQASETTAAVANEPKTYAVTFTPETAVLGKKKEASIKILPGTATELTDPDGTVQGTELTFKISLTNNNKIGENTIGVSPSDFRLVLEDNTSISQHSGSYLSSEPESTTQSSEITYRLPAGAKPKTLNLFYDETRASVSVSMQ